MGSQSKETECRELGTDSAEVTDLVMQRLKRFFPVFLVK